MRQGTREGEEHPAGSVMGRALLKDDNTNLCCERIGSLVTGDVLGWPSQYPIQHVEIRNACGLQRNLSTARYITDNSYT